MTLAINQRCASSILLIFVVLVFVPQIFYQLYYDKTLVFIAPRITGKRGQLMSAYDYNCSTKSNVQQFHQCNLQSKSQIIFAVVGKSEKRRNDEPFSDLCEVLGKNGKSICEEPDNEKLSDIISRLYLKHPTGHPYSFESNPPELRGQIGVPHIVDKLLGDFFRKKYVFRQSLVKNFIN